jgi:ADP-heptose:LPS heptosyltransferase
MKYNLGCGFDYRRNWINVDCSPAVGADVVHDLLSFPWPFPDDSADEIVLSYVLEELFMAWPACLEVFREVYRIAKPDCLVAVRLQDTGFSGGQIRSAIPPKFLESLDLVRCEHAVSNDAPTTAHALTLQVDFAIQTVTQALDDPWSKKLDKGEISYADAQEAARSFINVVKSADVLMRAKKPFAPGRSLREKQVLVVRRLGGLGDVLMALSAFRAVKAVANIPIVFETKAEYADFVRLCPHVDAIISSPADVPEWLKTLPPEDIRFVDWSAIRFGLSQRHEVDAFLQVLGIFPPDHAKGLDIVLPANSERFAAIDDRLDALPPNRGRIVIHPGVTDPNRTWPVDFWRAVARHALDRGCAVISIGRNAGTEGKGVRPIDEPGLLQFSDTLDLAGSLHLLRRCDMLISGDAGPVQIAGASDIRIVGLYSSVHGGARLPFRHGSTTTNAVAVEPECSIHPCYSRMMDGDTFVKFCQTSEIDPRDLSAVFAQWCLNPDRYSCIREPRTLQIVKSEIDQLAESKSSPMATSLNELIWSADEKDLVVV